MEDRKDVLARTRSRIFSIKNRKGKSWGDIFAKCDKDQSGSLDYNELAGAVRHGLGIPEHVIRNYELRILFEEMDVDGSGGISIEELLDYLQQGFRTPEQIAARAQLRIQRVRRNLKAAFQALSSNEMSIRKLFKDLDLDSDSSLSFFEFKKCIRNQLQLSVWDVCNSDVREFYNLLDRNGDGIHVDELLSFVRNNQLEKSKEYSFVSTTSPIPRNQVRGGTRMKTYKQRLLEDNCRSVSLPDLSKLRYTSSVVGLGRSCAPASRNAFRISSQMFFAMQRQADFVDRFK